MGLKQRLVVSSILLGAVACTEPVAVDETSGGSSTGMASTGSVDSTSSSGETSADGTASSSGSDGSDGSSDSTTGEPVDCSPYFDEQDLDGRDVVITNESAEPVIVAAIETCRDEYLAIEPTEAGAVGVLPSSSSCNLSCEDWFENACGCPTVCVTAPAILLAPGAVLVLPWSGAVYVEEPAPEACYQSEGFISCADDTCPALRSANGAYRLTLRWALTSALGDESCLCEPDATGLCTIEGLGCRVLGPASSAEALFEHPSRDAIELVL